MSETLKTEAVINEPSLPTEQVAVQETPKPQYSGAESILAWICLLAGYFFCRLFPVTKYPLGGMIFVIALFVSTAVILHFKGFRLKTAPVISSVASVLLAVSLPLNENITLHLCAYGFAGVAYLYFVYTMTDNSLDGDISGLIIPDLFRAAIILPFASLGRLFTALSSGKAKATKTLLKALLGIAVAIIPTAIVFTLLSYDRDFVKLMDEVISFANLDLLSMFFSALFGLPIGMYLFGLYASGRDKTCKNTVTAEGCRKTSANLRIAPLATVLCAVIPILLIYVVFFISQWKYYISGFVGVLPDEIAYSRYAREGFFQLCTVSAINLGILSAVAVFMKRESDKPSWTLKVICLVYSAFTLALMSTAVAKLVLYINRYGLTTKRVYAAWFMAVLALIFLLVILKQFIGKIKIVPASIAVFVGMFALLSLGGADGFIANYNVDRYIGCTINRLDVDALDDLGYASVPALARLVNSKELNDFPSDNYILVRAEAEESLRSFADELTEDSPLTCLTLPQIRARAILTELGYIGADE